jgi:predicted dehydrogenase
MQQEQRWTRRAVLKQGARGLGVLGLGAAAAGRAGAEEKAPARVRVGYIGVGGRGTTHLRTMLEADAADVTAVCDIDPTALDRAASRGKPRPTTFEDYRKLLASPDVDAVLSALPCDLHARVYLDVIAAGKDLYAEKPMCITVAECDAVVKAAEASGLAVTVGYQRRFDARMREGIRRLHAGDVGEIVEMRTSFLAPFGPLRGWQSKRARSGDWMVEQAVHVFDVMNWALRATPLRAFGMGRKDIFTADEPDRDVTDYYAALIEYPGGVVVDWLHSWVCPKGETFSKHTCQVIGRKGAIDLYGGRVEFLDAKKPAEALPEDSKENDTRLAHEAWLADVRKRRAGVPRDQREPASGVRNGRDSALVGLLVRKAVDERRLVTWEEMLKSC